MNDYLLRGAHASLNAHLPGRRIPQAAHALFRTARARRLHFLTGTEAGQKPWLHALVAAGAAKGYSVHRPGGDAWIAIRSGWWRQATPDYHPVHEPAYGRSSRGISELTITPTDPALAPRITILATHLYTTKRPGYEKANNKLVRAATNRARAAAKGHRLVFLGLDTNRANASLRPCADDWRTLQQDGPDRPTGPGGRSIDTLARWAADGRVAAPGVTGTFPIPGLDHRVIHAAWPVRPRDLRELGAEPPDRALSN